MSSKNVRMLSIAIVLAFALTVLAGCGAASDGKNSKDPLTTQTTNAETSTVKEEQTQPGEKALEDYTDEMKVTVYYAGGAGSAGSGNNDYVKYVKERFKINLEDSTWPAGEDAKQKISMYVASGDMPDVIQYNTLRESKTLLDSFAKAGMLVDVESLINSYMPDLKGYYTEDILNAYRNADDNKLYILPSFTINPALKNELSVQSNMVFAINKEIKEKLQLQDPKTPDELYDVLKKMKGQKNSNGESIIPLITIGETGGFDLQVTKNGIMPAMFGLYTERLKVDEANSKMVIPFENPLYLKYLQYMSKLFREGLINPETFSSTWQQNLDKMYSNRAGFVSNWPGTVNKDAQTYVYEPVPMIKDQGVTDSKFWLAPSLGWSCAVISKKTSDPVRLAKFINWQVSKEGWPYTVAGPASKEDGQWYIENGKSYENLEITKKKKEENPKWDSQVKGAWAYWICGILKYEPFRYYDVTSPEQREWYTKALEIYKPEVTFDTKYEIFMASAPGAIRSEKWPAIEKILLESEAKAMMSGKDDTDVEKMYKTMMEEANKAGLIEVLKEDYERYIKMK